MTLKYDLKKNKHKKIFGFDYHLKNKPLLKPKGFYYVCKENGWETGCNDYNWRLGLFH